MNGDSVSIFENYSNSLGLCKLVNSCIDVIDVFMDYNVCSKFIEHFNQLTDLVNEMQTFNLTYSNILGYAKSNSPDDAKKFVDEYLNFIRNAIRYKNYIELLPKDSEMSPKELNIVRVFNIHIKDINKSVVMFSSILKLTGNDCITRDVTVKDVLSVINSDFEITPIKYDHLKTTNTFVI
jgi:hypothetical protein